MDSPQGERSSDINFDLRATRLPKSRRFKTDHSATRYCTETDATQTMMFLVGGIPNIYYARFINRARRELSSDDFTGLPLFASTSGAYALDASYCQGLIGTLVAYVEKRAAALDGGLGIVLLRREWEGAAIEGNFWPFALCKETVVRAPIRNVGNGARRAANAYASAAISLAGQLRRPIAALTMEYRTRFRRTPLLLPIRHFNSATLASLLSETLTTVRTASNPTQAIHAACNHFEAVHPFVRTGRRRGGFRSPAGIQFDAPGREDFMGGEH